MSRCAFMNGWRRTDSATDVSAVVALIHRLVLCGGHAQDLKPEAAERDAPGF